jgi:anti-sigma B factor antagonist
MAIDTRISRRVAILDVRGKLAVEEGAKELRTRIKELTSSGHQQIILNLSDVSRVDSAGIEALVSSYTTVTKGGGEIKFASIKGHLHHLLEITRLLAVFETYEEETQAIESFFPAE